jgi:hypothetical protein
LLSGFTALTERNALVSRDLAEMISVGRASRCFSRRGDVGAHRHELDLMEGLDDAAEREAGSPGAMAEDSRPRVRLGAAVCRRSGLSHRRELIESEGDSLEIIMGRSTTCSPGMTRATRRCSASGSRGGSGRRPQARGARAAQRCRKLSPSFVPPAAFTAELAAYARDLGRHRLADDLAELAAAHRTAAP